MRAIYTVTVGVHIEADNERDAGAQVLAAVSGSGDAWIESSEHFEDVENDES